MSRIGFVTDVEGNLEYWNRWVGANSEIVRRRADGRLELAAEAMLVYGGDAVDKGPGDIRLCRELVGLKERYPERVVLVAGNRDLNKLRLTAELSAEDLARPAEAVPRPHWDGSAVSYAAFLDGAASSRATKCRWLLEHTLGCVGAFEFRRQELEALGAREPSDEAVAESFLREIEPGGSLRAYLERAVVAARIGDTLFVHGSCDRLSAGFVPPLETRFDVGRDGDPAHPPSRPAYADVSVDDWIDGLNDLLRRGLEEHRRRPGWDDAACARRGGEALMALQNRCALWGRSVVSNCWADGGNVHSAAARRRRDAAWTPPVSPTAFEASSGYASDPFDADVAAWLKAHGVRRVVSGHKPVGDSPALLSPKYHGVELVCADTSYADTAAPDNRGRALTSLTIHRDPASGSSRLTARGALRDGRAFSVAMPPLSGLPSRDLPEEPSSPTRTGGSSFDTRLGTRDPDGWWFKARLHPLSGDDSLRADGTVYLQSRGEGRRVEYRDLVL